MRLIDADGHNGFPNLALMRISAWHKARGDDVQWWFGFDHYDIVYISKVFLVFFSDDAYTPPNADIVIRGGSGYAIRTISGVEIYDPAADKPLPEVVEHVMQDYFCQACGAPMTYNAVDILWKRLEAMQE